MSKKYKFTITYKDYLASSGEYWDDKCPFYAAFKRRFPDIQVNRTGTIWIAQDEKKVATIEPEFKEGHFKELERTKKSFKTTLTLITN